MRDLNPVTRGRWFLFPACGLLSGAPAAHHSQAPYDMTREVVIEGTVVELQWRNPHIAMMLEVVGENGASFIQEIEVASVSEVRSLGVERDSIPIGASVAVRAHPGRRGPQARVFGLGLTRDDGERIPLHPFGGFDIIPDEGAQATGLAGRWAPSGDGLTATFGVFFNWPYVDGGAALQEAAGRAGSSLGVCEDYPPPLLSIFPDLREIEVTDTTVAMRFEAQGQNLERIIRLNERDHPDDVQPTLLGDSIGWWEGETLVVDTTAFTVHPHGIFAWVASGPDKHLVERFSVTEDRRHLRYELTLADPASLTEPASHTMLWDYRPDLDPSNVACDPEIAERLLHDE